MTMGLNINKSNNTLSIIRMNGRYCAIIFIVHYIICLNLFIYKYYDEDKHHYDECLWRRYPIDFSDYHKYGPSLRTCIFFLFDDDYANWVLLFVPLVVAIIAYVRMQRRPLTLKQFLKTDMFVWLFFSFIFIYKAFTYTSNYINYVINDRILHPILLILMIWFRYRQYKKYGIIRNWINFSKIKEVLCLKKILKFASRFRHTQ